MKLCMGHFADEISFVVTFKLVRNYGVSLFGLNLLIKDVFLSLFDDKTNMLT